MYINMLHLHTKRVYVAHLANIYGAVDVNVESKFCKEGNVALKASVVHMLRISEMSFYQIKLYCLMNFEITLVTVIDF